MARSESEAALGDYVALVRRRRSLVLVGTLVGLLLGLAAFTVTPASYRSTTSVLVQPTGDDTNVANGRTTAVINLDTEAQIVTSSVVARRAAELLGTTTAPRELAKQVTVGVPANTSVLNISFAASDAAAAQRGARAFATAYLANREAQAEQRLDQSRDTLTASIARLNDQLQKVNEELNAGPSATRREYLSTQRTVLVQQLQSTTQRLGPLTTEDVVPGRVITDAQRPLQRAGLSGPLLLGSGLVLGLLLGLALALLRDRTDRRVRTERDLVRLGLDPLVAVFDLPALRRLLRVGQDHDEPMRQCRNALLARMTDHRGSLVVTSVSPGPAGATVAAALAVTLARSGVRTAFVCADTEHDVVPAAFGTGAGATLVDALRGRSGAGALLHPVAGTPDLAVLPSGNDGALYSEMLQDSTLRPVLAGLEELAEVVVLDVAPTAVNADAQTLVSATRGIVLVVVAGVTTTDELADAVDQMTHVGAALLGVVLVRPTSDATAPSDATSDATDAAPGAERAAVPANAWFRSTPAPPATSAPAPEPVPPVAPVAPAASVAPVAPAPEPPPVLEAPATPTWSRWTRADQPTAGTDERPSWSALERPAEVAEHVLAAPVHEPEPDTAPAPPPPTAGKRAARPQPDPLTDPHWDPLTDPLPEDGVTGDTGARRRLG